MTEAADGARAQPVVLYLASRSPRRQALLAQLRVGFTAISPDVEERWDGREPARDYVQRLAREKARAAWPGSAGRSGGAVLAADTAVVIDREIFGKPLDRAHGIGMLARLSGRTHTILTAVAMLHAEGLSTRLSISRVRLRRLQRAELEAYWETGEPTDKAGGYAIQGLAAAFVEHLEGSYSGVMGLPLFETAQLLAVVGMAIPGRGEALRHALDVG